MTEEEYLRNRGEAINTIFCLAHFDGAEKNLIKAEIDYISVLDRSYIALQRREAKK